MLDLNKTHVSTQTYGTLPFMPVELLSEGHMGKSADVSPAEIMFPVHCHRASHTEGQRIQSLGRGIRDCITCLEAWAAQQQAIVGHL
jgi:hypothetical protein